MFSKKSNANGRPSGSVSVGEDLARVLPQADKPWWQQPYLLRLNALLLGALFSSATVGYDGAMMNAQQVMPRWQTYFGTPSGSQLGLVNAIFFVGKVIGLPIVTLLCDKVGRRKPILFGICLCLAGAAIQTASVNFRMLVFSRALIGFSTAFMTQPSPLLIAEVSYPTHRGRITALYQTFYYFGAILAAWAGFGTVRRTDDWSWRIPCILQAAFPIIQLLIWPFIPESPRWLVAKGKTDDALAILVKHHGDGDEDSPLVAFELQEIQETLQVEQEIMSSVRWTHLVATPGNRKRVTIAVSLGFFAQLCGAGVVSYYISLVLKTIGITNPTHQSLINGLLQVFNFLVSVFLGALMVDRLGRRTLFLWSAAGMGFSYIAWTALNGVFLSTRNVAVGVAVVPMIFVFYFHYDISFTPLLYAYPTEIFPYYLRSKGLGLTLFSSYLALIFNLFVNPIAMEAITWKYYIVYCCVNFAIFGFIYFIYPETKGHSLEEIAEVFEKDSTDAIIPKDKDEEKASEHIEK
ncbi:general substrate transporter [Ilyonectria destructans]|nr:general substrate transporter [Ilyonectria destructans]